MKRNKTENVGIWNHHIIQISSDIVWWSCVTLSITTYIHQKSRQEWRENWWLERCQSSESSSSSPESPPALNSDRIHNAQFQSLLPYCFSSKLILMYLDESTTLIEYMVLVQAWGHCVSTSYKRLSKFIFWLECTIHATDPCNPICSTNTVALQEGFSTLGLLNGCDSLPQHSLTKPQRYPNISPDLIWCSPFFFFGTLAQNSSVPHSLEDCHSHNLATMVQPPHGKEILVSLGFFSWLASTSECERLLSLIKICYHHLTQQADGLWPPPFMKKLRGLRYWNQGRMTRKIINRDL